MTLTLLINFTGTIITAAATGIALFNTHLTPEYKPEVYQINMTNPVGEPLDDVAFYKTDETLKLSKKQLQCLEHNIFYEAGVEDYAGKIAVAQVTLNRLKTKRWGNTICKVVYAPHQFSWTKQNKNPPKGKLWAESKRAAQDFINGLRVSGLKESMYYHATWMEEKPRWAHHKIQVAEIGQHAFYKAK